MLLFCGFVIVIGRPSSWFFEMVEDEEPPSGFVFSNGFYQSFKLMQDRIHDYAPALHVGKINRGSFRNPELVHPRHRAIASGSDFNLKDAGSFGNTPTDEVNLGVGWDRGFACDTNKVFGDQWCQCEADQKVSKITGDFDDQYDRKWTLVCSKILAPNFNGLRKRTDWTEYQRSFGYGIGWGGWPVDGFLVGMVSLSDRAQYDRKFQFFVEHSVNWYLHGCTEHQYINNWKEQLEYPLAVDEVIGGISSTFSYDEGDRQWSIKVCKLRQKCNEIIKFHYDTASASVSSTDVKVIHQTVDNRLGTEVAVLTATITTSTTESLTESYEFSQTSGFSSESSLSIAEGVTFGVPEIDEISLEVTASFSNTFSFGKTWTRGQSKEYSETNGKQMTFSTKCGAGCLCTLDVNAKKVTGLVPYTIRTKTVDPTGQPLPPQLQHKCEEKGNLTIVYAFNGEAKPTSKCN